jgi:predicted outer membrane protein
VLNPSQQSSIEALQRAQGTAFDQEWLHQQVLAHQSALDLAAAYARGGDSEPLRRQAAGTIAAIQTHLARARRLGAEAAAQPKQ